MFGMQQQQPQGMFGMQQQQPQGMFGMAGMQQQPQMGLMQQQPQMGLMQQQPQMGGPQMQQAQMMCMEYNRRMEELEPALKRAMGQWQGQPQAIQSHSALQQGFVAYSYEFSDNPQLLQQAHQFNPAAHPDYAKFAQAVQNNPDPSSCYPVPLVGLPMLEARIQQQQQAVESTGKALEDLKGGFGNLKDHLQTQSLQKLEECRLRQQKLKRQLLQVVTAVETYAIHNGAARRNPQVEAQLEERFAHLEEKVYAPASARARVEELWVVLRGLLQNSSLGSAPSAGLPSSSGAARLSEEESKRCLQLTASQGELLEALQGEVALRKRDVVQFESALVRFANMPASGLAASGGQPMV